MIYLIAQLPRIAKIDPDLPPVALFNGFAVLSFCLSNCD
jgi:hypothetical protein